VLAACAVALAVRLLAIALFQGLAAPPDRHAQPDQIDYEATGWELASGHGFAIAGQPSWFRPPGTSFLIAAVYLVAGRSWAALRIVFALLSALTCAVLALLGRRAFGDAAGLVAAWALALDPAHLYYAMHFVSEVPYALLITAATLAGLHATATARRPALVAGLLLGAAILVRPQAALVIPLLAMIAPFARERRRALVATALVSLGAAAVVAPWVARNAVRFGHPAIAVVGAATLYGANNDRVLADPALCGSWVSTRSALGVHVLPRDEALYAERSAAGVRAFLRDHWRDLPRLEWCKAERLVALRLVTPNRFARVAFAVAWALVAPLAAVGLWIGWRRHRVAAVVVALPLLALLVTALLFYGSIRFRHSTEPLLVAFAALGAVQAARRARWRQRSASPGADARRR